MIKDFFACEEYYEIFLDNFILPSCLPKHLIKDARKIVNFVLEHNEKTSDELYDLGVGTFSHPRQEDDTQIFDTLNMLFEWSSFDKGESFRKVYTYLSDYFEEGPDSDDEIFKTYREALQCRKSKSN